MGAHTWQILSGEEDGAQLWVSAVGHVGSGEDWVTGKHRAHCSQHQNLLEMCL